MTRGSGSGAGVSAAAVTGGGRSMGRKELIALLALVMSMVALAIDLLLPALADIRSDFGLAAESTAVAGIITAYFLGLASSQIFFGVASDRFGRRPALFVGLGLYIIGALAAAFSPSLGWLLAARFVWGAGAASPRILTMSILRDVYRGEAMAKAMSFVMSIFILVPVVAPSLGAVLTSWVTWRGTIGFAVVFAIAVGMWALRLPETLREENRLGLTYADVAAAIKLVIGNRMTMGYMLAYTALMGAFTSYLASSEIIFSEVFGLGDEFPIIFGAVAIVMGVAVLINGNLVDRVGLTRLIQLVMSGYLVVAGGLALLAWVTDGRPGFWPFVVGLSGVLAAHALLIPNYNSAAMIPMASVAGIASAIIGTVTIAVGALIGSVIDRAFDGTVTPLSVGFLVLGAIAWVLGRWADSGSSTVADGRPAGD